MCEKCFSDGNNHEELAAKLCLHQPEHKDIRKITVAWDINTGSLVINPRPKIEFEGRFALCNPSLCKGKQCTRPHSTTERDAWNYDKKTEEEKGYCCIVLSTLCTYSVNFFHSGKQ